MTNFATRQLRLVPLHDGCGKRFLDQQFLFAIYRQGLVHLGKGTLTLGPYHCDRSLMMPVAVGGLLSVLVSFLDVKNGKLPVSFLMELGHVLGYRKATARSMVSHSGVQSDHKA